jgi:putative ABC transport system substrate-binding protein
LYNIGILQLTQNLDDAVYGFKDGLAALGVLAKFSYFNADGFPAKLPELAWRLADMNVDLIFACSTPAAQAANNLPYNIPVVFTPVFDPVGAGLVKSLEKPGGKATGVSGMVNVSLKVDFIKTLLPDAKTVGVLYQTDDANSCLETFNFSENGKNSFSVIKMPINKAADLSLLPDMFDAELDVIFLPIGRIVEENFPTIFYYAQDFALPIIASHAPNVSAGALGALFADHYLLGRKCAEKAAAIFKNNLPANIPVRIVEEPEIFLNSSTAAKLNLKIPEQLLREAKEIFE